MSAVARAVGIALTVAVVLCGGASAQTPGSAPAVDPSAPKRVDDLLKPPSGYRMTGDAVRAIARRQQVVREERSKFPGSYDAVFTKGAGRWQVSFYSRPRQGRPAEIAQVLVDDRLGGVLEAWAGYKVAWTMARGYPGAFGRKVNSPLVWLPLTVLFIAPFLARRPRMLHLDLAVLLAFGISLAYFNAAQIDTSVPLVHPLLAYLLGRMLWIGLRRRAPPPGDLPLLVPVAWLGVAVVFLLGFRVGLNITNSNVIDVGYSGVIGADRIADGLPLYGNFPKDNEHGDTYGPVAYLAYLPFEQLLPWSGRWDDLHAAHAAAITFDLGAVALLFAVGRRLSGNGLGIVLAYLWCTFPFTLYVSSTNGNDALVALLALAALLVAGRPVARGAAAALGGLAKFGSLGLVPLLALHDRERRVRSLVMFAAGFVVVAALAFLPVAFEGTSLRTVYDRTLGFQAERGSPFSIWGLYDLDTLQALWQVLAATGAVAVAFLPRRRDLIGLAALAAAVLIALQAGVTHWFYLYIVWFFPLVAVALIGRFRVPDPA